MSKPFEIPFDTPIHYDEFEDNFYATFSNLEEYCNSPEVFRELGSRLEDIEESDARDNMDDIAYRMLVLIAKAYNAGVDDTTEHFI